VLLRPHEQPPQSVAMLPGNHLAVLHYVKLVCRADLDERAQLGPLHDAPPTAEPVHDLGRRLRSCGYAEERVQRCRTGRQCTLFRLRLPPPGEGAGRVEGESPESRPCRTSRDTDQRAAARATRPRRRADPAPDRNARATSHQERQQSQSHRPSWSRHEPRRPQHPGRPDSRRIIRKHPHGIVPYDEPLPKRHGPVR